MWQCIKAIFGNGDGYNCDIINNNAGNGDGYNCDNALKQYLVTAMDINMTVINNNAGNGDGYKRDNNK